MIILCIKDLIFKLAGPLAIRSYTCHMINETGGRALQKVWELFKMVGVSIFYNPVDRRKNDGFRESFF